MKFKFQSLTVVTVVMTTFTWSATLAVQNEAGCWDQSIITPDANVTCLNGDGGVECNRDVCLADDGVDCNGVRCKCRDPYDKGDGLLFCALPGEEVCYLVSDPNMGLLSKEKVSTPVNCRFLMTSLETKVMLGGVQFGKCVMEAYSWGVRGSTKGRKGQYFIGGMEVRIQIVSGTVAFYHATRITGESRGGVYQFVEEGDNSEMMLGPYGQAVVTDVPWFGSIFTWYDVTNNIAEVRADLCGLRMGYRPVETIADKADGQMDPGVYIKVNTAKLPVFLPSNSALCMAPPGSGSGVTLESLKDWLMEVSGKEVDEGVAIVYRLLKYAPSQDFPGASQLLGPMANTTRECDTKSLVCAIQNCFALALSPKFVKCWTRPRGNQGGLSRKKRAAWEDIERTAHQEGTDRNLQLLHKCLQSFCDQSEDLCEATKAEIEDNPECRQKLITPPTPSIMDFNCGTINKP